jgi:hypothetical protein
MDEGNSYDYTAFILLKEKIPIRVISRVNRSSNCRSNSNEYVPKCKILFRIASTEYVAGSIRVMKLSHAGKLFIGNNAPLRKNKGNTTKLTIN